MRRRQFLVALVLMGLVGLGVVIPTHSASASEEYPQRVSVSTSGGQSTRDSGSSAVSADGRVVAFTSNSIDLVSGTTNGTWDVFVHDRSTGVTTLVSVGLDGAEANSNCYEPQISADGNIVAFSSAADNLVAGDDTNTYSDVFVHDRTTGVTSRVSNLDRTQGFTGSYQPSLSADGNIVAFRTDKPGAGVGNDAAYVFVHDRRAGVTRLVSPDGTIPGYSQVSVDPAISGDGNVVVFQHDAVLHDGVWLSWVLVAFEWSTGTLAMVGVGAGSNNHAVSGDGRFVAFDSGASNVVSGDTNNAGDVFVRDRLTSQTTRVSVGRDATEGNGTSAWPSISSDGRWVTFSSWASNIVAGDTNTVVDVFVHDRATGVTTRVSVDGTGTEGNGESASSSISANGRIVSFGSSASNLVAGDTNGRWDVFVTSVNWSATPVRTRVTGRVSSAGVGLAGAKVSVFDATTGAGLASTITDTAGQYTLANLTATSVKVKVTKDGYKTIYQDGSISLAAAQPVVLTVGGSTTVDVSLTPLATKQSVTGRVSSAGVGLAGAKVSVFDAVTGVGLASTITDTAGQYTLANLTVTSVKVKVTKEGYRTVYHDGSISLAAAQAVALTLGGSTTVDVSLTPLATKQTLTGRVSAAGVGLAGARVAVFDAVTGVGLASTITDTAGQYTLANLTATSVKVKVTKDGYKTIYQDGSISLAAAQPVALTVGGSTTVDVALVALP